MGPLSALYEWGKKRNRLKGLVGSVQKMRNERGEGEGERNRRIGGIPYPLDLEGLLAA